MPNAQRTLAHENPFRAQRIEALPFYSPAETAEDVWNRFRANEFRGAIIGPHGSGKTTLAEQLLRRAKAEGMSVRVLRASRSGAKVAWTEEGANDADLLFVDGADLLGFLRRRQLMRLQRVLVTSRWNIQGVPLLTRTRPTPEILDVLIEQLAPETPAQLRRDLYFRHSGNIREVFRRLFDARQ